jgi:hypothetical protein
VWQWKEIQALLYAKGATQDFPPPAKSQELRRLRDLAAEVTAYSMMHDEIAAASRALEPYHPEFEALLNDGPAVMKRAHHLFSEEQFVPLRCTADDVHRAFEAVGYPPQHRGEISDEEVETIVAAILYLANDVGQRLRLSRQLLMMLPEYVSAGRYLDAWLIQFSAFQMTEAPDKSNPFLFEMFNHGLFEWSRQTETHKETLLHELDIDLSKLDRMNIEESEAWFRAHLADPAKIDLLEAYYAAHPLISDRAQAAIEELEHGTLLLLERDDAADFYLSPGEIEPWQPLLEERLSPINAQTRQAVEQKDWSNRDILHAMSETLVEVAQEMIPVIFTPKRIERLKTDLRGYRRRLQEAGEREAAARARSGSIRPRCIDVAGARRCTCRKSFPDRHLFCLAAFTDDCPGREGTGESQEQARKWRGEKLTTQPKHLIEVSLPLKPISAQSAREKSIRHGHISTLHL